MEDIFGNHKAERLAQGCSCNPPRSGLPSLCPCLRSLCAVGLVAAPRKGSTLTSHPADSAAWARAWIVGWELVRQPWPCAHPSAQWCRYVCWAVLFVSWITYAIDRSGKPHSSLHTCPLNVVFVCFFFQEDNKYLGNGNAIRHKSPWLRWSFAEGMLLLGAQGWGWGC